MFGARKLDVESGLGEKIPSAGCALLLCSLGLSQWIAQVGRSGLGNSILACTLPKRVRSIIQPRMTQMDKRYHVNLSEMTPDVFVDLNGP